MTARFKTLTALAVLAASATTTLFASVPEPSTILYGKVLHRAYGNEHKLTEGTVEWTLRDESGTSYTYTAELEDLKGVFSYRISIPHQALSTGLSVDSGVVPLGVGESSYEFESIQVNGYPAAILWSEVDFLELIQNSRAATHRIDLLVSYDLLDSDGDGMPDWWEKFYGLNWQLNDAGLDPDGDGINNGDEYLGGTDPLNDDRAPSLQTLQLAAYGESNNGVWLRSVDADTPADSVEFTLTSLPAGGYLHRMQATPLPSGDVQLGLGSTFTQEDLNLGRVAYRHSDPQVTATSFNVTLSDGINVSEETEVAISVFPSSTPEDLNDDTAAIPFWWRDQNIIFEAYLGLRENVLSGELVESALLYLLGKDYGWTLWDQRLDTLPVTLQATGSGSHFILGGSAADVLGGGAGDDIINGGDGDDTLTGGAGLDLFVIADAGLETITDFDTAADILDVADLLSGASGSLNNFLQVTFDGTNSTIGLDADGSATGYDDSSIVLENLELTQDDLHRLWSEGQLLTGAVQGYVTITIESAPSGTIEEGYETGDFVLRRNGPTNLSLTATVSYTGSAINGVDYQVLFDSVQFESGADTASVSIEPLTDGLSEGTEQVVVNLLPGAGYVLGTQTVGQVAVVDAQQRFSIRAQEPLAAVGGTPGLLVVSRQGPVNEYADVFLSIGGSAVRNVDYSSIPTFLTFDPNRRSMVIPVNALATGALANADTSRTVEISLQASYDDSYLLGAQSEAVIRLLSDEAAFQAWVLENNENAGAGMSEEELTSVESPRTGLQSLLEYALSYGVDFDDGVDAQEQAQFSPRLITESDGSYVEFTKRLNDPRLVYTLQVSKDLTTWEQGAEAYESVEVSEADENAGRVRYKILSDDGEACFVRVVVELND